MANTQILKRRIRSVRNTKQITKAMELVAAAKLRRVQTATEAARVYGDAAVAILQRMSSTPEAARHPYFNPPTSQAKLYITFNSDRGLAGAYNANVFNMAAQAFAEDARAGRRPMVIAYGRKGARHFSRGSNIELIGEYANIPDEPDMNVFAPVIETITSGVAQQRFGEIELIFTESVSTMQQRVRRLALVPVQTEAETPAYVYEFEPDIEAVMRDALKLYFEASLRRARVEAATSEHAMRMVSMGNANRNAGDLIEDLTLELNATRQATITQEVAEIIGGASAVTSR